jgi:hypothetical protein
MDLTNATYILKNTFPTPYNTVERTLWALGDGTFGVQTWLRFDSGNSHQDGWVTFTEEARARAFAERSEY